MMHWNIIDHLKQPLWFYPIVVFYTLICGCQPNPVTGKQELHLISEKTEVEIGTANYAQMQQVQGGTFQADPELVKYVQNVGNKLARVSNRPQLPFEFVIVNDPVPNAWALPGGKIAINRGLLTELKSEAELAAVLGHEIVHAVARHGAKSMEQSLALQTGVVALATVLNDKQYGDFIISSASIGAQLISLKHGRGAESEADKYGIYYMVKAGYDPHAAIALQETFLRLMGDKKSGWVEGLLASHPPSEERIRANKVTVSLLQNLPSFRGEVEYQKALSTLRSALPAYEKYENGKKELERGKGKRAFELAEEAIRLFPQEALFYGLKGQSLESLKKNQEALIAYDMAIKHQPQYFQFYLKRGLLKYQEGNSFSAKKDLERSLSLMPTGEAHEALGNSYLEEQQTAAALAHYRQASVSSSKAGKRARQKLASLEPQEDLSSTLNIKYKHQSDHIRLHISNLTQRYVQNIRLNIIIQSAHGKEELVVNLEEAFMPRERKSFELTLCRSAFQVLGITAISCQIK